MWLSEKKITGTMDFLVHKMGRKPAAFGRARKVLLYSVEESDCPKVFGYESSYIKRLNSKDWSCFTVTGVEMLLRLVCQ